MLKSFRINGCIPALISAVVLLNTCVGSASAKSITGETLSEAQQTDLFQWFHFKEAERKQMSATQTFVSFTTGMQGFQVQLIVLLDKEQHITQSSLFMPRDFVDSPKYGMFARDIAKSYLLTAVPDADRTKVTTLAHEIEFSGQNLQSVSGIKSVVDRSNTTVATNPTLLKQGGGALKAGDQAWIGAGTIPALPSAASAGYLTYQGKQTLDEENFSQSRLRIENTDLGKTKPPLLAFTIKAN